MEFGLFELKGRIGEGGMGEVWKAVHQLHDLPVAVKVITDQYATDPDYRRRFKNEVRSVASLNHPGIVRILDYGEATEDEAAKSRYIFRPGSPYLVMELAEGGSLHGFESELDWPAVRGILIGLLEALGHAHARGIIHRDLKPSNVLLTDHPSVGEPTLKLTDFGLAFTAERAIQDSDEFDDAAGTPFYMAPEQFRSRWRDFGPWTDLYGLGCLTWRILTGEHPYSGRSLLAVARSHLSEPLPAFEPHIAVPDELEGWLARLLEKHPNDRYRSAADALWGLLQLPADVDDDGRAGSTDAPSPAPTVTRTRVTEPLESSTLNKLGPWSDSYQGPVGTESLAPNQEPVPDRTLQPAPRPGPPVPRRWQQSESDQPSMRLVGAGRQLFNLREFPMVGRRPERDRLWETLCGVAEEDRGRLLLLEGPAGVGKSRLARWLGERASQVGAAHYLRVNHSADSSDTAGLIPALARALSVRGLEGEDLEDRLRKWCQARSVEESYEWRALSGLLAGSTDLEEPPAADDPVRFSDKSEIWALVSRFIGYLARERPLVVHLDDLQWGHETLDFLHHFFESGRRHDTPVLFVGTLRDDLLADRRVEARLVEQLCEAAPADRLAIGPLGESAQRALVEELLRLTPAAASRVLARAGGNPLFAVELVRDWIERDILETTDEGFALTDAAITLPDGLHAIWANRLDQLLEGASTEHRRALQLAATLGGEVDEEEWRAACQVADLSFPGALLDRLGRQNLLRPTDRGWRFAHNILREVLTDRTETEGVAQRLNAVCAETLQSLGEEDPDRERLAHFLIRADNHAEALAPLLDAVEERGRRGETGRAEHLLSMAEDALTRSDLGEDSRCTAQLQVLRGRVHFTSRMDHETAEYYFHNALELAEGRDWPLIEIDAHLGLSRLHHDQGNQQQAVDGAERARDILSPDSPDKLAGQVAFYYGMSLLYNGELDRAEDAFERAERHLEGEASPALRSKVLGQWAGVMLNRGELEAARHTLEQSIDVASRHSLLRITAQNYNLLGDCERRLEHYEQASECYRRAEQGATILRAPRLFPVWLGRVQIALEQKDYETARRQLERAESQTRRSVFPHFDWSKTFLALEVHAGLGNLEAVERRIDELSSELRQVATHSPDSTESLDRSTRLLRAQNRPDLADRVEQLAESSRLRDQ